MMKIEAILRPYVRMKNNEFSQYCIIFSFVTYKNEYQSIYISPALFLLSLFNNISVIFIEDILN